MPTDLTFKAYTEDTSNGLNAVMRIENLKKSFGNKVVLKDINFHLNKGENLVILGKSGSGKSVLIKCIVRLIDYDDGKLNVFKKNLEELDDDGLNEIRKKIGFLFQGGALYDSMTVRENLEFPFKSEKNRKNINVNELVENALEDVGLLEAIDKMPSDLSGGMRKRVALARTLIMKPDIMLYDEPTTGLDPITSRGISKLILQVQKKYNTASVIITHDIECARITANRVIVMKEGLFVAEGTFKELEQSEDEWIRSFFE